MNKYLIAAALVCLTAGPAAAADEHTETIPKAELFGGYSVAREDGESFHGWAASVQFNVSKWLAIGAETSGHYKSHPGVDITKNSYLFGPRFSRRGGKVVPFGYVLGGVERTSGGVHEGSVSVSASHSTGAVALGGGIDIELSHTWAIAIEGDALMVRSDGAMHATPRFTTGLVYYIGHK